MHASFSYCTQSPQNLQSTLIENIISQQEFNTFNMYCKQHRCFVAVGLVPPFIASWLIRRVTEYASDVQRLELTTHFLLRSSLQGKKLTILKSEMLVIITAY